MFMVFLVDQRWEKAAKNRKATSMEWTVGSAIKKKNRQTVDAL